MTDPKYRVLPPAHVGQFKPLDRASAKRLLEMTQPWYSEQPFTRGFFADVVSTPISRHDGDQEIRRVRKWLYQRGVPFQHPVFLSWSDTEADVEDGGQVLGRPVVSRLG